jgi:hypothetical protein
MASLGERSGRRWFGVIPIVVAAAIIVTLVLAFLLDDDPIISIPARRTPSSAP